MSAVQLLEGGKATMSPARNYSNTAQPTSLTAGVDNVAATLPVASTAGYPNPPFTVAIERGDANEEVILVQGKVSNAFTNCLRGYNGTVAVAHSSGKAVEHVTAAIDYTEASEHIYNTGLDHHTQYLNLARHSAIDHGGIGGGGSGGFPVGSAVPFFGTSSPDTLRFLLCYGQAVSRSTYAVLFSQIGTTNGAGDGVNTFNVPDFRGRVPVGSDSIGGSAAGILPGVTTLGARGGEAAHVLLAAEMPSHNHGGTSGSGGSHTHSSGASSSAGSHSHTMGGAGGHSHTLNANSHSHGGYTTIIGWPTHSHTIGGGMIGTRFVTQVPTGSGSAVATTSGPWNATNTTATDPSPTEHEHTIATDTVNHSHDVVGVSNHTHTLTSDGSHTHTFTTDSAAAHTHTISSEGSGTAHNNLQPYIVVSYLIRAA